MTKLITSKALLKDLRELIEKARQEVARQVNSALVLLYWRVGKRIRQDILKDKRAGYGEQIVSALRRELSWTHFKQIIYLDDPLKRDFYAEMKPADKGQMELCLRWLAKYEQKPDEESPIGLILCAGKKKETVELLELKKSGIRVASYWTKVLPKDLLQKKLHEAIQHARDRLARVVRSNEKKLLPE